MISQNEIMRTLTEQQAHDCLYDANLCNPFTQDMLKVIAITNLIEKTRYRLKDAVKWNNQYIENRFLMSDNSHQVIILTKAFERLSIQKTKLLINLQESVKGQLILEAFFKNGKK